MTADQEFAAHMAATSPRMKRVAILLCGDTALAQDLLQTAYARTYAAWRRVRRGEAEAYTRRVLVNAHIDWCRRRPWLEVAVAALPETSATVVDVTGQVEDRVVLAAALATLTPRERTVLVLRYYLDLSEQQTASELGVGTGTVKKTASVALRKLRSASLGRSRPDGGADLRLDYLGLPS